MSNLVGNWSELDLARELSRSVAGVAGEPEAARPQSDDYVQFRAARFWAGELETPPSAEPERDTLLESAPDGFDDWDALLAWCLRVSGAKTVFVMDWQGFLIETQGSWPYEDVEAAGTQLMVTLEQADRMELGGRRVHRVAATFESFTICGMRVPPGKKDSITLGVIAASALAPEVLRALAKQANLSLPRL